MKRALRRRAAAALALGLGLATASPAFAGAKPRLEPLVPSIRSPLAISPGIRPFLNRLSVSPSFGWLGSERLFALNVAYNPNDWLGWEASLGHNPGQSVHAVLHSLTAVARKPLPGRLQPYVTAGYGMMMVSPGPSLNADPVTRNALTTGGGLEIYIRDDLALRADFKYATVFGSKRDGEGIVAYPYAQETIGLSFYRTIAP